MTAIPQLVSNLLAQSLFHNQLEPGDPKVLVLVLGPDRETVLGCELKLFSEIAAIVGVEPFAQPSSNP